MQLKNRKAIITGANRGLGREIAKHFVLAGASVVLTARDAKLLDEVRAELAPLATQGNKIDTLPGDVAVRAVMTELFQADCERNLMLAPANTETADPQP